MTTLTREDISVVVVGAGAAGFASALKLIENGFSNLKVLEAENRIGGRIFTTEFSRGVIDLGAQWCHGIQGNIVHNIAGSKSFAETKMDFSRMTFSRSDGSLVDGGTCETVMRLCEDLLEKVKSEATGSIDELLTQMFLESMEQDFFKEIDKNLALLVLENFKKRESSYCGCEDLGRINIKGYKKFKDCDGPTWLNWKGKGYKTIFDLLLKNSVVSRADIAEKILLNREVVKIDYRDDNSKIKVQCADGSVFNADHVIVTVSLGVLKSSEIFLPALPIAKKQVIERIGFGAVGKVFLSLSDKFWTDDWVGLSLLWSEEDLKKLEGTNDAWLQNIYCFYTVDYLPNVLLGRLAGDKIAQMEVLSDKDIVKSCEYVFDKFLPNTSSEIIITQVRTSKWKTNCHFGGTYSYHTDESSSANQLAEAIKDVNQTPRILFAGEATHDYFFSTVHGAIESGFREAERLINIY